MSAGVASVRARRWLSRRGGVGVVGAAGVVLGVGLAAGLLAGCAGEPVPDPTYGTPPVSTPRPTPTPTGVTAPERPADMERGDDIGAVAAATYFMELYRYVLATGDLTEWDAVADSGCTFCSNVHDSVSAVIAAGGRFDGVGVEVADGHVVGFDDTLRVHAVQFQFSTAEFRELDAAGSVVRTVGAEEGFIILDVGFTGTGWNLVTGDAREASVD